MDRDAHNPDTNPDWTPLVKPRLLTCLKCEATHVSVTNHTGTVWGARCHGSCRQIITGPTSEAVLPYHGPHRQEELADV
jgi:hypothetical protein